MSVAPREPDHSEVVELPRLERHVAPRGQQPPLSYGFLVEGDLLGHLPDSGVVRLRDLDEASAVVLVGEAGAGKTYALRELAAADPGHTWINLRDVHTSEALRLQIARSA